MFHQMSQFRENQYSAGKAACIDATRYAKYDGFLIFIIEADGFLRYMVRNIVGTLVDVGLGKISSQGFRSILASKDRRDASATAPAHGLFLVEVKY